MDGMQDIVKKFPFWEHLSDDERALVLGQSALRTFDAGQLIGGSDSSCTGVFLIVHGDIRVSLLSEEGKEVTLFRLGEGECCVTTASCVIRQISFDTLVTATRESTLLVVPIGVCEHLANVNIHVKVFMLEVEAQRYSQVVRVLRRCSSGALTSALPTIWLSDAGQRSRWSSGSLKTNWRVISILLARR